MARPARRSLLGFTLIEVLVAMLIMALLALMSWRGIDGMARAQEASSERADQIATLQTALAQWQSDLDQMLATPQTSAVDFDGRVLRVTRRDGPQVRVVGWARRSVDGQSRWLRWQSAPLASRADLQNAWAQAARWGQNPSDADRLAEVSITAIDDWQIFYYRNDSWSNPLSTSEGTPPPPVLGRAPVTAVGAGLVPAPDGVRLVLKLSPGQVLAGTLTRDWVKPTLGGGKS